MDNQVSPTDCLRYPMGLPTSVVITGCESMRDLEQGLAAAYGFQPPAEAERKKLLARTQPASDTGRFEKYKTSDTFDGTARNPSWLG